MKRLSILSLFAAAALCANAAVTEVVAYDFTTIESLDGWFIDNANEDDKTWVYDASESETRVFYSYSFTNPADDWLISPVVTLPDDGSYALQFTVKGSSYGEAMDVWTGTSQSVADMNTMRQSLSSLNADKKSYTVFFDGTAGEQFYVGFHATSPANGWKLYLYDLKIMKVDSPVDLSVVDITSPVSGEDLGQETVTVSVENRGTATVNSFDVCYQVDDNTVVTEVVNQPLAGGETMQYSFTAKADLSISHYTYTIKAWTSFADDFDTTNDSHSVRVKHIGPASVPYIMGFEPDDDTSSFTYLNLNNDEAEWEVGVNSFWTVMSRTGNGFLAYNYDKNNNGDDWVFIDPITMEAGYYSLKFWYASTENHEEKFKVCWGNAPTPEAMTNVIVDYSSCVNPGYLESINVLEIPSEQQVYIGFYCYSNKDENWLTIDDLSIERIENTNLDIMVSEIKHPWEFLRASNKKSLDYTLRNLGITDASVDVKVYLDGNLYQESVVPVGMLEVKDCTVADIFADVAPGSHTVKVEVACENDIDESNNVLEHTFTVLGEPTQFWDFEDGVIPESFTMREYDGGTVDSAAGGEFNELGWGIFSLEHYMYGTKALAGTSWLSGTDAADRWIILPQLHVDDNTAILAWDASSFNVKFLDDYKIKVSTTTEEKDSYETLGTFMNETISPKTRGLSLGKYAGNDIYLAINLVSENGDALVLDNIGLYGGVNLASLVGIDEVNALGQSVVIAGNILTVNNAADAVIEIIDTKGGVIARVNGNMFNLDTLCAGIYVARVTTGKGVVTRKFMVK